MAYTTIKKPSDYFNTVLYEGDGTSDNGVTGVGFQPDWTWLKARDSAYNHRLYDNVRGVLKNLQSNSTAVEATANNGLISFDSDGFSVSEGGDAYNTNGQNYVSWNWLGANGTASNTDGSITSTVSANTTSGFSICTYTGNGTSGATFGHGLNSAPEMVIIKQRNSTGQWRVGATPIDSTFNEVMNLNLTNAKASASSIFNSTAPSSTVVTLGNEGDANGNNNTFVAYCFHSVKGFSKFGKFSGTTGEEFVYTGFKPAFVMLKRTNTTSDWYMFDNKRNTYNLSTKALDANTSDTEATYGSGLDLLSNGFVDKSFLADNGNELIYMAFAEEPLVGDNPATAR